MNRLLSLILPARAFRWGCLERPCPECNGSRTLLGETDLASIAAWLDCTTCTAIPKRADDA